MGKVSGSRPALSPAPAPKSGGGRAAGSKPDHAEVKGTKRADQVAITSNGGKVEVHGDRFDANNSRLRNAKSVGVDTRKGNDKVTIYDVKAKDQKVKVKTGLGRDTVDVARSSDVKIRTGRGRDHVSDVGSSGLDIKTGRGRDTAKLVGTTDSRLDMGRGRDHATAIDANNVHIKSARTTVHTSSTAAARDSGVQSEATKAALAKAEQRASAQETRGHIEAKLDKNGTLNIAGSKKADNVTVRQEGSQVIVESGGKAVGTFSAAEVKNIRVNTGKGDDQIVVKNIDAARVSVNSGRGKDRVDIISSKNVTVDAGRGADQVHTVASKDVSVRGGRGRDTITDVGSSNLQIHAGRGRDEVNLTETLDSKVDGGRKRDHITLTDVDNVKTKSGRVHISTTPRQQAAPEQDLTPLRHPVDRPERAPAPAPLVCDPVTSQAYAAVVPRQLAPAQPIPAFNGASNVFAVAAPVVVPVITPQYPPEEPAPTLDGSSSDPVAAEPAPAPPLDALTDAPGIPPRTRPNGQ